MPNRDITIAIRELGFNTTLLGSESYVISQLTHLADPELSTVRQAFMKNAHPRYLKEFFYHQPYGKRELYNREVQTASLEKLAKLVHVTALLLQTKAYLFWKNGSTLNLIEFLQPNQTYARLRAYSSV